MASLFVALAAHEWYRSWRPTPPAPWTYSVIALAAVAYAAWKFMRVRPQLRKLRQAIDGERAVGQFLERLIPQGYKLFHDVLGEGFNLDHVAIGPAGIITIETKTWSKPARGEPRIVFEGEQIQVGARAPDAAPLIQARAQARWIAELLTKSTGREFPVHPAVVFPGWFVERRATATREVWVLEPKALPHFLEHEPHRLDAEAIAMASFHLSRFVRASEEARLQRS